MSKARGYTRHLINFAWTYTSAFLLDINIFKSGRPVFEECPSMWAYLLSPHVGISLHLLGRSPTEVTMFLS